MLRRLAYLGVTPLFGGLRLLTASDADKTTEILVLRHQLAVLQRQLDGARPRFTPADRALLAALLHRVPRAVLGRLPNEPRPPGHSSYAPGGPSALPRTAGRPGPGAPGREPRMSTRLCRRLRARIGVRSG